MKESQSKINTSHGESVLATPDKTTSGVSYLETPLLKEEPQNSTLDADGKVSGENIFYLAYGSNLASKTFLGMRGIKPLSQKNVHCPTLTLTFDLGGFPYLEPCFANTRYTKDTPPPPPPGVDYHKTHWKKGVVGVAYEVTPEDFLKILATEGAGASYKDIIVPCYPLQPGISVVPEVPTGEPFDAHTLYCPRHPGGPNRSDPNYAQPSPRYLGLLTTGAEEHNLPEDYREYLAQIRPYVATRVSQRIGRIFFAALWAPIFLPLMTVGGKLVDDKGVAPPWFKKLMEGLMATMWASYDGFYKRVFGDGERTIESERPANLADKADEVRPLILAEQMKHFQDVLEEAA